MSEKVSQKIAVTCQNRKTVTDHPGRCRRFKIYHITEGEVRDWHFCEIKKEEAFHEAPADKPHPLDGVQVLISARMATWLEKRLEKKGTRALATSMDDPDAAVTAYLQGTLPIIPAMEHKAGPVQSPKTGSIGIPIVGSKS